VAKINSYMSRFLSGNNPRIKVDLKKMFGFVPDSSQFRHAVGQELIDLIRQRTEENINRQGKRFRNYTKAYAESIGFAAAGKDKSDPNLKKSGDMLAFIDIVDEGEDWIEIGWTDPNEAAKAHGHITGNVGVERDFFGLPESAVEQVAEEFKDLLPDDDILAGLGEEPRLRQFVSGERSVRQGLTFEQLLAEMFELVDDDA
jgi:hypothetical protein